MYALALAGAGASPPLRRCDLRAWCSKTVFYKVLWAWKIQNLDSGEMQKLGHARRADVHNRILFGDGPASTQTAPNVPQDWPTEAPKIGPRWVSIAPRWANISPRSPASRLPPTNCHQQLSPTNCHQPIVINQLSPTNCHQPSATNQLPPTNCHQLTVINRLSSTNCQQPIVTNYIIVAH